MSVPFAYAGVILIWSTTPLAIQWSSDGPGFLFGIAARMTLGLGVALVTLALIGSGLVWHRAARQTYLVGGLSVYAAMTSVYWAAQYIPSGWMSVIFGLSPMVTGIMAHLWLGEQALAPHKLLGMALGLAGLGVMFGSGAAFGNHAVLGLVGVLLSVLFHAWGTVWVKRIGAGLSGLRATGGALLVATPLFVGTWAALGEGWPAAIPDRAAGAILYLGVVGSVIGFALFYYVLARLPASRVALIALITPVTALLLGHAMNGEPLTARVWAGAALIVVGLASYELGARAWGWTAARRSRVALPKPLPEEL